MVPLCEVPGGSRHSCTPAGRSRKARHERVWSGLRKLQMMCSSGGNRLGGGSCYLLWAWRGRKRRATETRGAQTTCGPWGASTSRARRSGSRKAKGHTDTVPKGQPRSPSSRGRSGGPRQRRLHRGGSPESRMCPCSFPALRHLDQRPQEASVDTVLRM